VGIDEDFVNEFIKKAKRDGRIYRSGEGEILTAVG